MIDANRLIAMREIETNLRAEGQSSRADCFLELSDEIDRLRGAVERLREYAKHRYTCNIGHYNPRTGGDHPCNCGYDELRKELEEST